MTQIIQRVPLDGDVFTEDALANMVGQEPHLTINFDYRRPFGRCVVTAAGQQDGFLLLTIDVPDAVWQRVHEAIGKPSEEMHLGFTVADASLADEAGHRHFKDVRIFEGSLCPEDDLSVER